MQRTHLKGHMLFRQGNKQPTTNNLSIFTSCLGSECSPLISWLWDDWTYWLTFEWSSLRSKRSDQEISLSTSERHPTLAAQLAGCNMHAKSLPPARVIITASSNNAPWHEEKTAEEWSQFSSGLVHYICQCESSSCHVSAALCEGSHMDLHLQTY